MKHIKIILIALLLAAPVAAQRGPVTAPVDPEAEQRSAHNLDVGRQYFKKKAWAGARGRLEEVVATHPEFTRIDEVYYMLGVVYFEMDEPKYAREMFEKLLDARPNSSYAKRAKQELERLGPAGAP
jgi:outer membrane protein assembly factor BamD (BamD/ComL family)